MAIKSLLLVAVVSLAATNGQDPVQCTHPYENIGDRCIYIDPFVKGTMTAIRDNCKAHSGDILWLDSYDCDFYRVLLDHIHSNQLNEHDYWMGITDEGHEGDWRYLKNNAVVRLGAPHWVVNNPSDVEGENCAIMQKSSGYYWIDVKCDSEYNGICRSNAT